ncbi:hypothetical protein BDZ97DRAFT_1763474 [Flammula alnicola]|nr:hypothetical protein BDZ97DRAFT_1763474 [Flammula alnicola]
MEAGSTTPTTHWLILCVVKRRQRVAGVYLLRLIPQDPTYLIRLGSRSDRANMIFHATASMRAPGVSGQTFHAVASLLSLSPSNSRPHPLLLSSPDARRAPFASSNPVVQMPTHTIASAIIELHTLGIPWDYPVWQAATGVKHGLFPEDPKLLPKGWTPEDASNIASYFDQYRAKPTEDEKIAFVSQRRGTALPGREKWRDWINAIWRSAGIHDKIIAVIAANNCHPLEQTEDASSWPMGAIWLPVCLDAIAVELFGDECLDAMGCLPERFRAPTQALAQRTWSYLTERLDRSKKRFAIYEQEALEAFNDLDDSTLTGAKITAVIRAVAKCSNAAELLNTPENIEKMEKMELELERLMEGLGAQVSKKKKQTKKTPAPRLFKLSEEMLRSLASEQAVQDIILLYRESFDNPLNAADDVPLVELTHDDLPLPTFADVTVHYPPNPQLREGETATQDRKIIVFPEFPSMSSLIKTFSEDFIFLDQPWDRRSSDGGPGAITSLKW